MWLWLHRSKPNMESSNGHSAHLPCPRFQLIEFRQGAVNIASQNLDVTSS